MCGIAGFVDFSGGDSGSSRPALDAMSRALAHRGPDGWGYVLLSGARLLEGSAAGETSVGREVPGGATVGFAHRRLSIIDLSSGGHQPMAAASRRSWITFNGEIYNYRALRDDLVARGGRPRTSSDTEVLVERLDRDGVRAVDALRGMFAFAWWDERAQRLLLARDRFGIKPLVYVQTPAGGVAFASEPRALFAAGLLEPHVDAGQAAEFFARGSIDVARAGWSGIQVVAPGECLMIDAAGTTRVPYWSLASALLEPTGEVRVDEVARTTHTALLSSVSAHLVADVPVAVFLSGGIDSMAIVAAARDVAAGPVQTFTVSMPGSPLDESAAARSVAAHFGAEHTEVSVGAMDLDAALDEFFAAMQRPSIDGFNTFLVARAARHAGVRVALSGVGGDELFGGYPSFTDVPKIVSASGALGPIGTLAAPWVRRWPAPRAAKIASLLAASPRSIPMAWWAYRELFDAADVAALTGGGWRPPEMPGGEAAVFSTIRWLETREFLERQLLPDADAYTMCHGLELRTPFVDHLLLEQVAAAGRWPRARGASYKQTLFRALPGLARPAGVAQPKRGFVLPFDAWLRDALTQAAPRQLRDVAARLRRPRYAAFVDRFLTRRLHWSRLWAIYVYDRFAAQPAA